MVHLKAFSLFKRLIRYPALLVSQQTIIADLLNQEGQHPLTGQRAVNFRLLANQ